MDCERGREMNEEQYPVITEKLLLSLRLAVQWRDLKQFCKERTSCSGCPYNDSKVCAVFTSDMIFEKIAFAAEDYLIENGLML